MAFLVWARRKDTVRSTCNLRFAVSFEAFGAKSVPAICYYKSVTFFDITIAARTHKCLSFAFF